MPPKNRKARKLLKHKAFDWWHKPSDRFSFLLVISTIALAIIAGLQWHTLEKTDETLRATHELSQRPWISISVRPAGGLDVDKNKNVSILFDVILKNSGNSPATSVHVVLAIYPTTKDKRLHENLAFVKCYQPNSDTLMGKIDETLFPGETKSEKISPIIHFDELTEGKDDAVLSPLLISCVSYRAMLTGKEYVTHNFFIIDKIVKREPLWTTLFTAKELPASAEKIHLMSVGSRAD